MKRVFVLIIAALAMVAITATAAYAYTLSQPLCHYQPSTNTYKDTPVWNSRHLNHNYDYWAYYDYDYNEYYCVD
jgi:hypothetical protein